MTNRWRWTQNAVAAILAIVLLSLPQIAAARDNCNRQYSYQNRAAYRNDRYETNTYRDNGYYSGDYRDYRATRSPGKSAAIIGGSAAAGAVVGGLAKGGKGAAIGAAVGGIGGLIYDRATRNNGNRW